MDTPERAMRRLFVAVPLPEELRPFVATAQTLLPKSGGIRLLEPAQWHVTLAFIGQVDAQRAEAARAVVEAIPVESGGEVVVDGFLLLPGPRRARVVALELEDSSKVLQRLFETVAIGLETSGVMQREKRPFHAHVTLARLRVPGPVQPTSDCGQARFRVESVCLYESKLRREGAQYSVIARKDLKAYEEPEKA